MKKNGFTLVEMLIVISIIGILSVLVGAPYNLYSDLAKLRVSTETISQTINEARNSSAGLINSTGKNQNIAIFFTKGGNKIELIGFPFDYNGPIKKEFGTFIRSIPLEKNVNSNQFIDSAGNNFPNLTILYKTPNGDVEYYKNESQTGILKNIIVGIENISTGMLSKSIEIK